jgi:hypothetical protein
MASTDLASLSLYIVTYNCGRAIIDTQAVASQLFRGLDTPQLPDVFVLSLQEIAPIPHSLIGGSWLVPYFTRFHDAVQIATRKHESYDGTSYTALVEENVGMTAIMVFVKDPSAIEGIETGGVGVGTWEMGDKGAVGVRFSYRDLGGSDNAATEMTFIAAHLAAMEEKLPRRNEDWKNIVRGLVFSSSIHDRTASNVSAPRGESRPLLSVSPADASIYKPTSHLFLAGDLNYRTSLLSPSPEDYDRVFPQPHQDSSSVRHYSNLFEHDQLNQERAAGRTCHGLIEAKVNFPPTYKYVVKQETLKTDDEVSKWLWAKHRWPSWCDRILYLDIPSWLKQENPKAQIITQRYSALPLFGTSDHRAVAIGFLIPLIAIPRPDEQEDLGDPRVKPPFDINPDWKSQREKARILEIIVGFTMYFTSTWEGAGVLLATTAGVVGSYFVLRALGDF